MATVIDTLINAQISCEEKIKILDKSFKKDTVQTIINAFIKKIQVMIAKRNDLSLNGGEKLIEIGYNTYCDQKHSSLNSYDLPDEYYQRTSLFLAFTVRFFSENNYIPKNI